MEKSVVRYEEVTKEFLKSFNIFWDESIELIGLNNAQLSYGNRLRPQICLWGYLATVDIYDISKLDCNYIANIAVSIELIHKASILIDDWIDDDEARHGKASFHIEYNPQKTVLCALNMIGIATERIENVFEDNIILPNNYNLCLKTLLKTIRLMAKGALEELCLENKDFFNKEKIREITQLETAEIIGNSLLLGYYAGTSNINPAIEKRFKDIGDKCGYLFQALNDLEAFVNPLKATNHKGALNLDIHIKRKNLAIATLYELANKNDKKILTNTTQASLISLMNKYKVIETMSREMKIVYRSLMDNCIIETTFDLSSDWSSGFQNFIKMAKKYAEKRLY